MPQQLFDRAVVLRAGPLKIEGLRIAFRVRKTPKSEPNEADISVYNLSRESRSELQDSGAVVSLEAGYGERTSQLFLGEVRRVASTRQDVDVVTRFQSGDGRQAIRKARIDETFAADVSVSDVVESVAESLGVGLGNVRDKLAEGDFRGALEGFTSGFTASGKSADEMDRLTRTLGLEWSVQDGEIQLLRRGEASADSAILLSPATGLVGSPEPAEDGAVEVTSLLIPEIRPARRVKIESDAVGGVYRVGGVTHVGDTHGSDWITKFEATPA